jgi:hypothetical protein
MSDCYIIQTGLVGVIVSPESSSGIKCKKVEVSTAINWDRKMLIKEAGLSCGIGTESCLKAELLFVSDFRGFV